VRSSHTEINFFSSGFTWRSNPAPPEEAIKTMRAALENGMNFWNAGEIYGTPEYNSLHLCGYFSGDL
jgi:pyridoxine 4-dehydrogenase